MKDLKKNCRIALVQAEPVMFDKEASLKKALELIDKASEKKPGLVVFPELFGPISTAAFSMLILPTRATLLENLL